VEEGILEGLVLLGGRGRSSDARGRYRGVVEGRVLGQVFCFEMLHAVEQCLDASAISAIHSRVRVSWVAEKRAERVAAKRLPTKGTTPTAPSEATSTTMRFVDFSSGRSGICPLNASSVVRSVVHTVGQSP
jgi:hypothetical protein